MIKKLRKSQKIILLIALIIVFYFLIHPEYAVWSKSLGRYWLNYKYWLWEYSGDMSIIYSKLILKVLITCIATGIALFIESWRYSNKEEE